MNFLKKVLFIISIILLISSYVFAFPITINGRTREYAGPNVTLVLNDVTFVPSSSQMPPIIINDRTLVPVREVFEQLGGTVMWDDANKKVTVTIDSTTVELTIDKTPAKIDGKNVWIDVPAQIINDKTMVPVRFISENCGLKVTWDGDTSTVSITKPPVETNLNSIFDSIEYKENKEEFISRVNELMNSTELSDENSSLSILNYFDESPESLAEFVYYLQCMNDLGGKYNIGWFDFSTHNTAKGSKIYQKFGKLFDIAEKEYINVSYPTMYYMIAENLSFDDIKEKGLLNFAYPANKNNKSKIPLDFLKVSGGYSREVYEVFKENIAKNYPDFSNNYALYEIKDISTLDSKYSNTTKWTSDNTNQKLFISSLGELFMLPGYQIKMKDGSTCYFVNETNYYIVSDNFENVQEPNGIILDKPINPSDLSYLAPVEKVEENSKFIPDYNLKKINENIVYSFEAYLTYSEIHYEIGYTRFYTGYEVNDDNIISYLVSKYSAEEIVKLYENNQLPTEQVPVGYKLPDKLIKIIKDNSYPKDKEAPIVAYPIDDVLVEKYRGLEDFDLKGSKLFITNTCELIALPGIKLTELDGTVKYYFGHGMYYTLENGEKPITLTETYGIDSNGKVIH